MKLCIQAVDSANKSVYEFTDSTVTLGRDSACDLPMPGTSNVSGRHAEITMTSEGAFLIDLQSTNGTFVNDRRIEGRIKVRKGDYFRLGHTGPSFQIAELDLNDVVQPQERNPYREAVAYQAVMSEAVANVASPDEVQPKRKPKHVPEYQADPSPAKPVNTGQYGQTRRMVLSLQNKNQKLMLSAGVAIVALLIIGSGTGFYFFQKTHQLSSQAANLQERTEDLKKGTESLQESTEDLKKGTEILKNTPDGRQISDRLRKSTVWINSPGSSGSGMLINAEEKTVVTNYHVVARPKLSLLRDFGGELTSADFNKESNSYFKLYPLKLPAKIIQIDMQSEQFDCKFIVLQSNGDVLGVSDYVKGHNARIQFLPPNEGDFVILATSRNKGLGNFKLVVSEMIQDVHPYVTVNFPEYIDGKAVAEPTHYLKLMKADSEKYKAKIVAWSDAKDLAILKLSYVPEGVHAVPLAKESAKSGHEVHSIGNPGGSPFLWIYTSGKVRTADAYHTRFPTGGSGNPPLYFFVDAWVIQTQSPTNPGDSGGPMVNDRGELVAVTQSISGQSANTINNFIDIREVRALLKTNNLHWIEK